MSLESAIIELTAELKKFNDKLKPQPIQVIGPEPVVVDTPPPATKNVTPAKSKTKATPAPAPEPEAEVPTAAPVSLADAMAKAIPFAAAHGRQVLLDLMRTKFKKDKVKDFENDPATLAKIIEAIDAYDPTDANI